MDRERAMTLILAEAFSEAGLAMLVENGEDPGWDRLNQLIEALAFMTEALADDDSFRRDFVSALFVLGNRVPEQMRNQDGKISRSSLYDQAEELTVTVTALIENWNHWPDWETNEFGAYSFETNSEKSEKEPNIAQVGGYRTGDITYCVVPGTRDCYPVRVDRLGNGYADVIPLTEVDNAYPDFLNEADSRRFFYPKLIPGGRFGGDDERLVNSQRTAGPELRLLPTGYEAETLQFIRERHASDPIRWPLPTGRLFERWFQGRNAREE